MTISRTCLAVAVCFLVAAQAVVVEAQILNASLPTSQDGVQPAGGNAGVGSEDDAVQSASWPSIPLPKLTMPKPSLPKLSMPKLSLPKWPANADGSSVSPLAPVTAGANKVSTGAKKAWEGTKEMFSFGAKDEITQPRMPAASQPQPSFWQRLTGREPEPSGPQTVAEWMSQPRIDP